MHLENKAHLCWDYMLSMDVNEYNCVSTLFLISYLEIAPLWLTKYAVPLIRIPPGAPMLYPPVVNVSHDVMLSL